VSKSLTFTQSDNSHPRRGLLLAKELRVNQKLACGLGELELVAEGDETDDGYGDDRRQKKNVHDFLQADE